MTHCLAYMTFPDKKEAQNLAQILLEKKLVACVNVYPQVDSYYTWKGKFTQDQECVAIAKLCEKKFEALERLVTEHHSYENPCVVKIPISGGSKKFLQWIDTTSK